MLMITWITYNCNGFDPFEYKIESNKNLQYFADFSTFGWQISLWHSKCTDHYKILYIPRRKYSKQRLEDCVESADSLTFDLGKQEDSFL